MSNFKLAFIKPKRAMGGQKATVHRTGKLGFNMSAAKGLKLTDNTFAQVAVNIGDTTDKNLYIVLHENKVQDSYKVARAGDYYYINLRAFYEEEKVDYINKNIVYDIEEGDFAEGRAYVFELRKEGEDNDDN